MASSSAPQPNTASVLSQPSSSQTLITNNCFKSSLIAFALRSKMKEPEFHSRKEGESHAPKYRSSVLVGGFVFTTEQTFSRRKIADQEVSRIALEQLTSNIIPEGYSLVAKASERRCEELIMQVPESTRPPLRQIEAMQETNARRAEAWAAEAEAKAATAEERERSVNDRLSQTLSRINVLEAQISCLRAEQTQLSKTLEKERQRAAESRQEYLAAKEALMHRERLQQSVAFCKAALNEYAAKLHMTQPTYNTVEYKSVIPYFVCTVDFNGTSYVGEAAGRKRDAENLAARSAILSLIGNSESGVLLIRTIRAKAELFDSAIPRSPERLSDHLNVLPVKDTAQSHEHVHLLDDRDKDIIVPSATDNMNQIAVLRPEPRPNVSTTQHPEMPTHEQGYCRVLSPERLSDHLNVLPVKETAQSHEHVHLLDDRDKDIIVPSATDNMNQIAVVHPEPRPNVSTIQQPEMPTHEPTPEATESTNEFQQPDPALPIDNVISAKKRKRNNYKANKRARIAAAAVQLPDNQGAPCAAQ